MVFAFQKMSFVRLKAKRLGHSGMRFVCTRTRNFTPQQVLDDAKDVREATMPTFRPGTPMFLLMSYPMGNFDFEEVS